MQDAYRCLVERTLCLLRSWLTMIGRELVAVTRHVRWGRYAPPSSRQYAEASPQTLETPCSLAGVEMFTAFWPVQESRDGEGGEEVP